VVCPVRPDAAEVMELGDGPVTAGIERAGWEIHPMKQAISRIKQHAATWMASTQVQQGVAEQTTDQQGRVKQR